jgi:hypothetical protein
LLQKEVIFQHDLERLIGPRPYPLNQDAMDKIAVPRKSARKKSVKKHLGSSKQPARVASPKPDKPTE